MNDLSGAPAGYAPEPEGSAFGFEGNWREFLPIAATNLLLILVTLGFYRFWAKARERRYLWSRTRFIDDRLEWTGTGLEMFIGFLIVMAVLIPVLLFFQFGFATLIARGYEALGFALFAALYLGLFYMFAVAIFRALRYRLSRTRWHGIRGGSDQGGWRYGVSAFWRYAAAFLTLGLLYPWAQTSLWRKRLGAMSYGSAPVEVAEDPVAARLMPRWLAIYAAPFALGIVLMLVLAATIGLSGFNPEDPSIAGWAIVAVLFLYIVIPLMTLAYYAKFYRLMVGETRWSGVDFQFNARTMDWLKLILGNIALVIVTLGFGFMYLGYRNWSFAVRHLEATGELNVDRLAQSATVMRTDAEGLADAFDIGAI